MGMLLALNLSRFLLSLFVVHTHTYTFVRTYYVDVELTELGSITEMGRQIIVLSSEVVSKQSRPAWMANVPIFKFDI